MAPPLLEYLRSDVFGDSVGFLLPPVALRLALQRSSAVRDLGTALRRGEITEDMIRNFTDSVVTRFRKGNPLPGDLALAALALVLEQRPTDFAEEFLCDLARLRLAEMTISIRVARVCLKNRGDLPKNEVRTFKYPAGKITPSRAFVAERSRTGTGQRPPPVRYAKYAEVK